MRSAVIFLFAACLYIACSNGSPAKTDAPKMDSMGSGSGSGAMCLGSAYDPCTDNTQCMSQMCHNYTMSAIQVCTVTCSGTMPCPNDASGATVACNGMGNCKPSVANHCHR
jgi:hypothetical protein